jgi:hypothetical protein
VIAALLVGAIVACGVPATSSPVPTGAGFVEVTLEIAPRAEQFFASQHRGRIVAPDGAVLADWEITDAAAPIEVPAGGAQLQGFTVFLSDFLQCSPDPAAAGREHCAQPTLGPSQVCAIPIEVVAGTTVSARFRSLPEGRCELTALPTGSG